MDDRIGEKFQRYTKYERKRMPKGSLDLNRKPPMYKEYPDARKIGLSAWARRVWMMGTFLFGLPAYVTYRLMRPKCVLAICRECGRGRRVDQDVCHHCGSAWDWPELGPPAWRVIGSFEEGQAAGTQAE